jgi:hypothetical protein
MRWFLTLILVLIAATSHAAGFKLNWIDNSTNEANFVIERSVGPCPVARGGVAPRAASWIQIGLTAPNVNTYDDQTTAAGQVYCDQVGARNNAGTTYSNMAETALPLAIPAAPSGLGVTVLP